MQSTIDLKPVSSHIPVDYSKFYEFRDPLQSRPYRLVDRLPIETLHGARGHLLAHGKFDLGEPLQFDADSGGRATDVLWSQMVLLFCVSGRLVRLLEENEITGWSTFPVQVYDRKGALLPDYHGCAVTGGICDQDFDRSVPFDKEMPGGYYTHYRGLYFYESQWNGSDMFWIGAGIPVCSDKVYRLFKKYKIGNIRFTPLTECEVSETLFNRGRSSEHQDLARELRCS